jgi:hypothetical protein
LSNPKFVLFPVFELFVSICVFLISFPEIPFFDEEDQRRAKKNEEVLQVSWIGLTGLSCFGLIVLNWINWIKKNFQTNLTYNKK